MVRSVLLLFVATLALPRAADACSCAFPEHWGFYAEGETTLPANGRGLLWAPQREAEPKPEAFEIRPLDAPDAQPLAVKLEKLASGAYLVEPTTPLKPGARYAFRTQAFNTYRFEGSEPLAWQTVTVTVAAEPLKLPGDLALKAAPIEQGVVAVPAGASCSRSLQARRAAFAVDLPPEIAPFAAHLLFTTFADGSPAPRHVGSLCGFVPPGRTWVDTGHDLLYRGCSLFGGGAGKTPPKQTVHVEVAFPGGGQAVKTKPITIEYGACGKGE